MGRAACRSPLDPGFRRGDGRKGVGLRGDGNIAFELVSHLRQTLAAPSYRDSGESRNPGATGRGTRRSLLDPVRGEGAASRE
jgi:hypothetical protein